MKKTYLLVLFLAASTQLFAQRYIDFETVVFSPVNGDPIASNHSFTLGYYWINHGPDSIMAGDTALAQFYIDTVMMSQGQYLFGVTVRPGDSVTIQVPFTVDVPDSLLGMGSFCVNSIMQGMGTTIIDTNQSNNKSCADSLIFMEHGLAISPDPGRAQLQVYPVPASDNLLFAYSSNYSGAISIRICDLMGRSLVETAQICRQGGNKLNIASLPPGNYIYSVLINGSTYKGIFRVSR